MAVEDLGSQNGTFVNGQLIQARTALAAGDEIAVGDSLFVLDPDLDVLAARYGEATVCLSPSEREPAAIRARSGGQQPGDGSPDVPAPDALPRLRELADRLGAAAGGEEVARALLSAVVAAFAPDRAFVLADDGAGASDRCAVTAGRRWWPSRARRWSWSGASGGRCCWTTPCPTASCTRPAACSATGCVP